MVSILALDCHIKSYRLIILGKLAEGTSILHRRVLIIGASGGCGIASLQVFELRLLKSPETIF